MHFDHVSSPIRFTLKTLYYLLTLQQHLRRRSQGEGKICCKLFLRENKNLKKCISRDNRDKEHNRLFLGK